MKDLLRLHFNKNNPERPEIALGKKMMIRKIMHTPVCMTMGWSKMTKPVNLSN